MKLIIADWNKVFQHKKDKSIVRKFLFLKNDDSIDNYELVDTPEQKKRNARVQF